MFANAPDLRNPRTSFVNDSQYTVPWVLGVKQYIDISIYRYIAIFITAIQYNMANREYWYIDILLYFMLDIVLSLGDWKIKWQTNA